MQDWNYIHAGCFELTLEISDNKWPNATEVRNFSFLFLPSSFDEEFFFHVLNSIIFFYIVPLVAWLRKCCIQFISIVSCIISATFFIVGFKISGFFISTTFSVLHNILIAVCWIILASYLILMDWWYLNVQLSTIWEYNRMSMLNVVATTVKVCIPVCFFYIPVFGGFLLSFSSCLENFFPIWE